MNTLLLLLNTAATAGIVLHGVFTAINAMGHGTGHGMRLAWITLTTGALGVLLAPLFGKAQPGAHWTCILIGAALYLVFDRRRGPLWKRP
jgi:hypothetical protein